jgi:hypothetical protein
MIATCKDFANGIPVQQLLLKSVEQGFQLMSKTLNAEDLNACHGQNSA